MSMQGANVNGNYKKHACIVTFHVSFKKANNHDIYETLCDSLKEAMFVHGEFMVQTYFDSSIKLKDHYQYEHVYQAKKEHIQTFIDHDYKCSQIVNGNKSEDSECLITMLLYSPVEGGIIDFISLSNIFEEKGIWLIGIISKTHFNNNLKSHFKDYVKKHITNLLKDTDIEGGLLEFN